MSSLSQYHKQMAKKHGLYWRFLRTVSSHAFRYYLSISILSLLAWFVILVVLFKAAETNNKNGVLENIERETQAIVAIKNEQGEQALIDSITTLRYAYSLYSYYYLYTDANQNHIAGEIKSWPTFKNTSENTTVRKTDDVVYFNLPVAFNIEAPNSSTELFAKTHKFSDGKQLIVAHSTHIFRVYTLSFRNGVKTALKIGFLISLLISFTLAYMTQREFDSFNSSIRRIMAGDLNERISTHTTKIESKELADNLNGMLDKICLLMEDVRRVSDNIAHDLNTPLARLRNNIQHLIKESPDEQKGKLEALLLECNGLLKTFSSLLSVAKIESGGRSIEKQSLALDTVIHDVIELYEPLAESKSINIETSFCRDQHVIGDRNLLFQVIANIFDNSIKYSDSSNRIMIKLQPGISRSGTCALDATHANSDRNFALDMSEQRLYDQKNYLSVIIADDGMGLPKSSHKKIFQRFYREEKSRSLKPGNGLGLSMVMAVMQIHQGAIFVDSPKRGGLSICLVLPTTESEATA